MEAFYFKYKAKYLNGEAKDYCYFKVQQSGKVTTLSPAKGKISFPKAINIPKGFEAIEKKEFDKIKAQLED